VNENWRKRYNEILMQLFGDLDILSFVGISRLNWIGHVNRMDNTRTVRQVFNINPQGRRLRGRLKTDGGTVYKQILINPKLRIAHRGKKTRVAWEKSIKEAKVRAGL
jgi:hypothetical protein